MESLTCEEFNEQIKSVYSRVTYDIFPLITRGVNKVSFSLVPQLLNHLSAKRLCVRDRVMTLHDACTNRTSRVLTVASLQRLKMKVLIPAPADCEVRSVMKFLNAQSRSQIEIHCQLRQI